MCWNFFKSWIHIECNIGWILNVKPLLYSWNKHYIVLIWYTFSQLDLRFGNILSMKEIGLLSSLLPSILKWIFFFFTSAWLLFHPLYRLGSVDFDSIISLNFPQSLASLLLAEQKAFPKTKQSWSKSWFNHSWAMCPLASYRSSLGFCFLFNEMELKSELQDTYEAPGTGIYSVILIYHYLFSLRPKNFSNTEEHWLTIYKA